MTSLMFSKTETEWVKLGTTHQTAFIGKETFCISNRDCYLVFFNLVKFQKSIFRANNTEQGEGIDCLAGHKTLNVFAFAEKCYCPRIFVMKYPEFEPIHILNDNNNENYMRLQFSEEFLFCLESHPSTKLSIWYWRTGKMLTTIETNMVFTDQILKTNVGTPVVVAQLALGTRKILMWDINMCGKKFSVLKHKVHIPVSPEVYAFKAVFFNNEGGFFILDVKGNIYMLNSEYEPELIIPGYSCIPKSFASIRDFPPFMAWYKGGILASMGIGDIKHYVKKGNWVLNWEAKNEIECIKLLFVSVGKEILVGITTTADIMVFDYEQLTFTQMKENNNNFNQICRINPVGEFFVSVSLQIYICVWKICNGHLESCLTSSNVICSIESNPVYPYFATGNSCGYLELINALNPRELKQLTIFNLTRNPLNHIYFHDSGRLLVTVDTVNSYFFVIEGLPGTKMQVIAKVTFDRPLIDFILVPSTGCLRLFVLFASHDNPNAASVITRYCLIKGQVNVDEKEYTLDTSKYYIKLFTSTKERKDRILLALPLVSKHIHEFETKRGDSLARLTNEINTGHQMCNINFYVNHDRAISYAYDGLVMVRNRELDEIEHVFMPHYRNEGGVFSAFIDGSGKYVVSLGATNALVCTSIIDVPYDEQLLSDRRIILESPEYVEMFSRETIGFDLKGEYSKYNWLEYQQVLQQEWEAEKCKVEKAAIIEELSWIRSEIEQLLTKNLEGPDNERLPVQDFELNTEMAAAKIKENAAECEALNKHFLNLIESQDRVTLWIKTNYWDKNLVQGQWVYGINSDVEVTNYVIHKADEQQFQNAPVLIAQRNIENILAAKDIFEPWAAASESVLNLKIHLRPTLISSLERMKHKMNELDEEENTDILTEMGMYGSTIMSFLNPTDGRYKQQQLQTFYQFIMEAFLSLKDKHELRLYFNNRFQSLVNDKKYEMAQVQERNAKLRHIISELNYFSAKKFNLIILDPEWRMLEIPEKLITVDASEVGITPYISPSEQDLLNQKAAEEERIRLLLLADDFRERALMAMMNGVLEIRWEDELRKEVLKPKVLLSDKNPEDYNEDDLRTIKEYENAVNFLDNERQRYLNILESEYEKIGAAQREAVSKFNSKVAAVHLEKLKVETSIKLEELKLIRQELYANQRQKWFSREQEIIQRIHQVDAAINEIQTHISHFSDYITETRNHLDTLMAKDKQLERIFKKDFNEYSQMIFEQCQKLYKKRPKYTTRNITSSVVLNELAKCLISNERTTIINLSTDATEYLKSVDTLDMYVGIIPMVDEHVYSQLCRYRRLKIESELRLKTTTLELSDGESAISFLNRHFQRKKDYVHKLQQEMQDIRKTKIEKMLDFEQQLCVKRGFVEIPTTGALNDFNDAILICRSVVENINSIILAAGDRKIKAMENVMKFRRDILKREWEHKFYQMEIDFYKTQFKIVESVKVTKEVQTYLKFKAKGMSEKQVTFEEEVEAIKASYAKLIAQSNSKLEDMTNKVQAKKKEMKMVDKKIFDVNLDVCECQLERDLQLEEMENTLHTTKMENIRKRSKLVRQIQDQHKEILMLKTELELLRLKTYPTLKYSLC